MHIAQYRSAEGTLLTIEQACQLSNLGKSTVRQIAEESGAVRRIGRSFRINRRIFFDYIEAAYTE